MNKKELAAAIAVKDAERATNDKYLAEEAYEAASAVLKAYEAYEAAYDILLDLKAAYKTAYADYMHKERIVTHAEEASYAADVCAGLREIE